jgi:AAA-like domain
MNPFRKKNPNEVPTDADRRLAKPAHPAVPKARGEAMGWALKRVRNHVTFTDSRMIAWYVLDPQMWSFRSVADGESLITAAASQIAELTGSTIYGRITTRPYPVAAWARESWENSPAPTKGYAQILERDQMQLAHRMQSDKLVYFGVDLGARSMVTDLTARMLSDVARRELEALQVRLDEIDAIMSGHGIEAVPAVGNDMAWLLARSFALGCPVPMAENTETNEWEDLAEFTSGVEWSAEPLAHSVRIDSAMNTTPTTRHVVVLTVGRMADLQIPERDEPWIAKTDLLRFPVEWSFRVDVLTPDETSREMNKLADRVHAQIDHYEKDHGKQPPKQLARQAARVAQVEDEMRSGFDGLNTRLRGWFRIAVSGETEAEALKRAAEVQNLFKPAIKIEREFDQYRLAREFVPGEPLANGGHARRMPVLKFAAGVPAATAEVGDKRGVLLGYTSGFAERAVMWDPHFNPEVVEGSGLVPIVGGLGSGKSTLAGTVIYKTGAQGVPWTVMDPSGLLSTLATMPEFKGVAQAVNLIDSERGALNPYALVPQPRKEWFKDEESPVRALLAATSAAEAQRRDLMYDALLWCLPPRTADREDVRNVLLDAVHAAPSQQSSTAEGVLKALGKSGPDDDVAALILRRLNEATERELSRLFFATEADGNHGEDSEARRLTIMSLKGLAVIDENKPRTEWTYEELMSRPILSLAAWSALRSVYRVDRHERKGIFIDEAHEITKVSTGASLTQKIATDSRKHNIAALLATQNASNILNQNVNNYVGAAFVGRTTDDEAQAANCRLLGLPIGQGYEAVFGRLSMRSRRRLETGSPREFLFRDGMGGESGRGGLEKVRIDISNHPRLMAALNTTADPTKRRAAAELRAVPDESDQEGAA